MFFEKFLSKRLPTVKAQAEEEEEELQDPQQILRVNFLIMSRNIMEFIIFFLG